MAHDHNPSSTLAKLLGAEAVGGINLILATIFALFVVNIPFLGDFITGMGGKFDTWVAFSESYKHFLHHEYTVFTITKTVHHWINDGLMYIFFFTIGLEVKREICDEKGNLNTAGKALLPSAAAISGVLLPAGIFAFFCYQTLGAMNGWAIPTATDIAFALGVLMLVPKSKVPLSVKVFLLAIAVIDDLIAVGVIAIFYSGDINLIWLAWSSVFIGLLFVQNRLNSSNLCAYMLWGIGLWVCVLNSGIHATVAGVITALMIPATAKLGERESWSLLKTAEHWLSPINAWFVMPAFALANAGIVLGGVTLANALDPVTLGVAVGLAIGKPLSIVLAVLLFVKLFKVKMAPDMSVRHLIGVGLLAGIGFTMSIFVTDLAYLGDTNGYADQAKLGILAASFSMALLGWCWFTFVCPSTVHKTPKSSENEPVSAKPLKTETA
jgi:NhaA family Na+:H+ antiporter